VNFRDWEIQMPGIDCDILMDTCDFLIHDRITGRNLSIRQAGSPLRAFRIGVMLGRQQQLASNSTSDEQVLTNGNPGE
tara:strand:+ start:244 stop:477 length:234 start_codon:yes stop_codon:yes gene_type:complete